jgi:hypothetical protein
MLHNNILKIILFILVLNFNHCLPEIDVSKNQIRLFQFLIFNYPDIYIQKQSDKIQEGQIIKIYLKLKSEPSSVVLIPINTGSNLIQSNITEISFNPSNWDDYQTIEINAPEDLYYEDNQNVAVLFGPYKSSDFLYNGKSNSTSLFYINNDSNGINLSISNPTEGGPNGSLTLSLQSKPKGNVTININNPSPSDLSFSSGSIIFTPSNWNVPQSVTITAIDDSLIEYTENFHITITTTSSDNKYNNLSLIIPISIYDND